MRHLFHGPATAGVVGHYGSFNTNNISITVNRLTSNLLVSLGTMPGGCRNLSNARLTVDRSRREVTIMVRGRGLRTFLGLTTSRGLGTMGITRIGTRPELGVA